LSLSEEQRHELMHAVEQWMESKETSECPMCGERAWSFHEIDLVLTQLVKVPCDNCAYVLFLEAGKVRKEPEGDEVEEADF
jgi:hypothetical protein